MLMQRFLTAWLLVAIACCATAPQAQAWGLTAHAILAQAAMAHLPKDLPAFLQTDGAKREMVYLQAEEDRLKIGEADEAAWTREWTTDHYIDLRLNGRIGDVMSISALPPTREGFDEALLGAPKPVDPYGVGFLPYAILEGYEQVRSDFGLWRLAAAAADRLSGPARRPADAEVAERERLTIHDIGIFSHFVGDGSQPLHVTVHYNGWGKYPNPNGFSESTAIHDEWEDAFVDRSLSANDVIPLVGPVRVLPKIPMAEIERYLEASNAEVVPFYELEKAGAFVLSDGTSAEHRKGVRFTAMRLAAGSQMLDSLILTAWRTSVGMKPSD